MNQSVVLSGAGVWNPPHTITNEELVDSYNAYSAKFNADNAAAIADGSVAEMPMSSAPFIQKASGIKQRYIYVKDGALDIDRMRPRIPKRGDDELSHQAEFAVNAAKIALEDANKDASDIDAVIVSCAYTERAYPAISIEVQQALEIEGFGFDMLVACSAATFALQRAYEMIKAGTAKCVLVVNPELTSPQVNYKDRDSHFIFGDVSTAVIIEGSDTCRSEHSYDILGTKAVTQFSNNIRSNFGYVSHAIDDEVFNPDNLFHQNGRGVFKEVCPMAAKHIEDHLAEVGHTPQDLTLGRDASLEEAPIVLDEYANTASAGSIIAFTKYNKDLASGSVGVICSFGAGYSIGSLVIKKR